MKNRTVLGILLACAVAIVGGCSSSETHTANPENIEIRTANQPVSGIDGQWVGVVEGMDGEELELKYRFKAEGEFLIGLIESRLGGGPISEGKIDGDNIEFKLNAGEFIIMNRGELSGDEIHLTETIGEEEIKVVLKRVRYDQ